MRQNDFGQLHMLLWGRKLVDTGVELPVSLTMALTQMTALRVLDLMECKDLESLPESFGQLTSLQWLNLHRCYRLSSLPVSFGQLSALRESNISCCRALGSLPASFTQLTALQKLYLSWNSLSSLPESFGKLTALQWLELNEPQCFPWGVGCSACPSHFIGCQHYRD
eukprot:GHUV01024064.1.p1 GENE.GHUV01024064.1~~GHUV01024064.1.p1  ORF type:complete len:167 (+),score=15.07 GHUV01024064.1:215-715(+)